MLFFSFMHSLLAGRRDITLFCVIVHTCMIKTCGLLHSGYAWNSGLIAHISPQGKRRQFFTFHGLHDNHVREQLDHAAKELGITKFILDQTLDDVSLHVLTRLLEGSAPGKGNELVWRVSGYYTLCAYSCM